jgi:hypothetical protein
VLFAAFAFGLLGFIDDVLGSDDARGFKGHVGALLQGRITTGFLKLFGGAGVAVVLVATPGFARGGGCSSDAVLIALAANLGNLLDRARAAPSSARSIATCRSRIVLGTESRRGRDRTRDGRGDRLAARRSRRAADAGRLGANVIGAVLGLGVVLGRARPLASPRW